VDGDARFELASQDDERVVEPLAKIHGLHGGLPEERVALQSFHDLGDPPRGLPDLVHQPIDWERAAHPTDDCGNVARVEILREHVELGFAHAEVHERRR